MNYIYGLYDELEPKKCCYVGLTQDPTTRMMAHRSTKNSPTGKWMQLNGKPIMKILARKVNRSAALELERFWIQKLRPELNVNGNRGLSHPAAVLLDRDVYGDLCAIQKMCQWPISLQVLANFAIRHNLAVLTRTFNPKKKP